MDQHLFWNIVETAAKRSHGNADELAERIKVRLQALKPAAIAAFDRLLHQHLDAANSWEMWGAAYRIQGGCSDDGFLYFRLWLITMGRKRFEAAIANPDSLASWVPADDDDEARECEILLDAGAEAYEEVTKEELPPTPDGQTEPSGEKWDFDDEEEMTKRLPRIAKKF